MSRGPSTRQLRVGETIRRGLSDILLRGEIHDDELQRLSITVGEVRMSPDLKVATIFVLPLGGRDMGDAVGLLARNHGELRRMIGRKLGLKFAPEMRFRLDETFDQMDETRRLLNQETVRRDLEQDDGEEE